MLRPSLHLSVQGMHVSWCQVYTFRPEYGVFYESVTSTEGQQQKILPNKTPPGLNVAANLNKVTQEGEEIPRRRTLQYQGL